MVFPPERCSALFERCDCRRAVRTSAPAEVVPVSLGQTSVVSQDQVPSAALSQGRSLS